MTKSVWYQYSWIYLKLFTLWNTKLYQKNYNTMAIMEPHFVRLWATCPGGHSMLKKSCHIFKIIHQFWSAARFDLRTSIIFYIHDWPTLCIQPLPLYPLCRWYYPFITIGYSIPLQNSNVNGQLNRELVQVHEWLAVNKLYLNIYKPNLWYSILIRQIYRNLLLHWK